MQGPGDKFAAAGDRVGDSDVRPVRACALSWDRRPWNYARERTDEIESHWQYQAACNPGYFNGIVHLLHSWSLCGGIFHGAFLRTNFKSYLYWRARNFEDSSVIDAFGSALIISVDKKVLLGRQRPGNVNSGLSYPPGGFIDAQDALQNGKIDIDASIEREVVEETGLSVECMDRRQGHILTFDGPRISIAAVFRCNLDAATLQWEVTRHISHQTDGELAEIAFVASEKDLNRLAVPNYVRILLNGFLGSA